MARLSDDVKKLISDIHPGIIATATKNGKPNVSAKGSFKVLDDEHVVFADMRSPRTIMNLKENPQVAVLVLDTATRKGCRLWGTGEVIARGPLFDEITKEWAARKINVNHVVRIKVEHAEAQP